MTADALETAEYLLDEICGLGSRVSMLAGAIANLADKEVNELQLNDLAQIRTLAEIIGEVASLIIDASDSPSPIERRMHQQRVINS